MLHAQSLQYVYMYITANYTIKGFLRFGFCGITWAGSPCTVLNMYSKCQCTKDLQTNWSWRNPFTHFSGLLVNWLPHILYWTNLKYHGNTEIRFNTSCIIQLRLFLYQPERAVNIFDQWRACAVLLVLASSSINQCKFGNERHHWNGWISIKSVETWGFQHS